MIEYKYEEVSTYKINEYLNKMAKQGWKLITMFHPDPWNSQSDSLSVVWSIEDVDE